ncbi:hypothetical protein LBMAG42_08380 [Deltaproteobacteria bacterium]|nr:hypothetical protein LBMAG42_08380 [Deltaproteobacteria bacterium]
MAFPALRRATIADLLAAEDQGHACEIIDGDLVEKALPDVGHAVAQAGVVTEVRPPYDRRPGGSGPPGGWWILPEVDVSFGGDVLRPDISGWRRDRVPVMSQAFPVPDAPDWVCEVLSVSTAGRDLGVKKDIFHRAKVSHYWVVDRANKVLMVFRWSERAYELALTATPEQTVRAEPFPYVALFVGQLFGIERDEPGEPEVGERHR